MNAFNITSATTAELLAFFNAHSPKPISRFSDRKTAERRVAALIAEMTTEAPATEAPATEAPATEALTELERSAQAQAARAALRAAKATKPAKAPYVTGQCPKCGATSDITCGTTTDDGNVINEHHALCHGCGHEFDYNTGRTLRSGSPADPAAHAAAVAASWARPEVAAARITRHSVVVDGVEYGSVRAAFAALGLSMGVHIAFRAKLKAAGTLEAFGRRWTAVAK